MKYRPGNIPLWYGDFLFFKDAGLTSFTFNDEQWDNDCATRHDVNLKLFYDKIDTGIQDKLDESKKYSDEKPPNFARNAEKSWLGFTLVTTNCDSSRTIFVARNAADGCRIR